MLDSWSGGTHSVCDVQVDLTADAAPQALLHVKDRSAAGLLSDGSHLLLLPDAHQLHHQHVLITLQALNIIRQSTELSDLGMTTNMRWARQHLLTEPSDASQSPACTPYGPLPQQT